MRGGLNSPVVTATANVVMNNWFLPLQPRLTMTQDPAFLLFSWTSAPVSSPQVVWGLAPGNYTNVSQDVSSSTYTESQLCGAPATTIGWHNPGMFYRALLGPLQPFTKYYYMFGDTQTGIFSQEYWFTSPPAVGPNQAISILAYGDMGLANDDLSQNPNGVEIPSLLTSHWMAQQINEGLASLLFHIGDLSYARGYSTEWDDFHDQITPIASAVPYMTCLGNHERDFPGSGSYYSGTDSGGECGVPATHRFPPPNNASAPQAESWYSVNYGPLHAVFMSTEDDFTKGSKQWNWIQEDLANVDRTVTPWLIFNGHRPMYIDSTNNTPPDGDQPVAALLREHVEPLLMQYQVDMAMWGHHHSFQRMCAVYQTKCLGYSVNNTYSGPFVAPIQMVIGMAGMGMSTNIETQTPAYVEKVDIYNYGFTRIDILDNDRLTMTFFANDGQVWDRFTIDRSS